MSERRVTRKREIIYVEEDSTQEQVELINKAWDKGIRLVLWDYNFGKTIDNVVEILRDKYCITTLYHWMILGEEGSNYIDIPIVIKIILNHHAAEEIGKVAKVKAESMVEKQKENVKESDTKKIKP